MKSSPHIVAERCAKKRPANNVVDVNDTDNGVVEASANGEALMVVTAYSLHIVFKQG
jgi:hypothetical protein